VIVVAEDFKITQAAEAERRSKAWAGEATCGAPANAVPRAAAVASVEEAVVAPVVAVVGVAVVGVVDAGRTS
jgi:hypothetical protein